MAQWLNVRKADGLVLGWQRSSKASAPPPDDESVRRVAADDALMASYFALEAQARAAGRTPAITESGGQLTLAADQRPYLRVEVSKAQVDADGVDEVTITVSLLNAQGQVRTNFNGTVVRELIEGRPMKLTFEKGVATKTVRFREARRIVLRSCDDYRLESPVEILAVE